MGKYESKAQARKLHALAARGEVSAAEVKKRDEATQKAGGFAKLPARAKPKPRGKP